MENWVGQTSDSRLGLLLLLLMLLLLPETASRLEGGTGQLLRAKQT